MAKGKTAQKTAAKSGGGCLKTCAVLVVVPSVIFGVLLKYTDVFKEFDVLNGLDSNTEYGNIKLQTMIGAFCLSPIVGQLLDAPVNGSDGENYSFAEEGDIQDEDYTQASIYAVLYGMYKNSPPLTHTNGEKYEFTFNTWGIAPSPYSEKDPQRHGKAAYAALVTQPPVLEMLKTFPEGQKLQIVEVGCGTGAGANIITREVHPNSQYLALDMQEAAIQTCKRIHATADNPGLECQRIPNGVGLNVHRDTVGKIPRDDSSVDIVVISETHIADIKIGDLEKSIFAEIYRVLKPGGFFTWGNAIPTRVWHEAADYLPTAGFTLEHSKNWTQGAIVARDEDYDRIELAMEGLISPYHVMKLPYFGPRCKKVAERLIANFYRHPGTALYLKMTTGFDSYMHQAWKVTK
jgi:SAM-dependent methyltransferase